MNFDFSDDAKTVREQARRFLTERAGPGVARRAMEQNVSYDPALWAEVAALGWPAARAPEAHGGLGLSAEEACVLAEEVGRSLAPVPLLSTLAATEALLIAGTDAQHARWLPGIADGSVIAAVVWAENDAATPMSTMRTTVDNGRLSGIKTPAPDLLGARLAIVAAQGRDGPSLHLLDLTAEGVEVTPTATLDLVRRHGTLKATAAPVEALGDAGGYRDWLDRAALLSAWEAIGAATAAMEMAVAYARERIAFGQRIGRYQAIKHKCADMYVKIELARAHAMHGAWAMVTGAPELRRSAAAARVAALDALAFCAEENVQVHGGIGFTWESDCQFYYRRNRQIAFALGARRWWADRLVRALERRNASAA